MAARTSDRASTRKTSLYPVPFYALRRRSASQLAIRRRVFPCARRSTRPILMNPWIVASSNDEGRRQSCVILIKRRDSARVRERPGVAEIVIEEPVDHITRDGK